MLKFNDKMKTILMQVIKYIAITLVTFALILGIQYLLMGSMLDFNHKKTIKFLERKYLVTVLNMLIIYLFYRLIIFITNRQILSWVILLVLGVIASIANHLKMEYRGDPIIPNELVMISDMGAILGFINKNDAIFGVVILVIAIIILGLLIRFDKTKVFKNKYVRWTHGAIIVAVLLTLFVGNNQSNNFRDLGRELDYRPKFWSMKFHYLYNGPLVGFLSLADIIAMDKIPYAKDDLNFMDQYKTTEKGNADEDEIVIYILGESFIDPTRIEGAEINIDPIPTIRNIMENYTSGLLYQSVLGGGTSKTEYEALTSFSNAFYHSSISNAYQFPVADLEQHPMVGDLYDNQVAIHTHTAGLYRRVDVFDAFGFDRFKYLKSETNDLKYKQKIEKHRLISDMAGANEVLDTISEIPSDESGFIYYATVQNHSPYNKAYYNEVEFTVSDSYDPETKEQFEGYLKGLSETDKAIKHLVDEVEKIDRPISIVFFGDHYPSFAKELVPEKENFKTDYFIYQNYQKKKLDYPLISTNFLSVVALQLTETTPSPFYNFLGDLLKNVSVIHSDTIIKQGDTSFINIDENDIEKKLIDQYKLLQYDIVVEDQHSIKRNDYKNDIE